MAPYIIGAASIVASAFLEGVLAGASPLKRLGALQQPWWAPPMWVWVVIGIVWYAICFVAVSRLIGSSSLLSLVLLGVLMLGNVVANVPLFRMGRLDLAFYYLVPYWIVLAAFIASIWKIDAVSAALFCAYAAYQLYAAAWSYRLWAMNGRTAPWIANA